MTFRTATLTRTVRTSALALTTTALLAVPAFAHAAAGPVTAGQQHAAMESGATPAPNIAFLAAHGVLASISHGHIRLIF